MNKKPIIPILFFVLVYANQGLSALMDQCVLYIMKESWFLSAGKVAFIGMITGLAWYIKPLWGFLIDYCPIKNYRSKYYLRYSYITILLLYLYVIIFGLPNVMTVIITGLLINFCIGINDVANDSVMVQLENKYKLRGKLQAVQWTSLAVAGLFVALVGAWLAQYFPEQVGYRLAYGIAGLLPLATLVYLFKYYEEKPIKEVRKPKNIFKDLKGVITPRITFCLVFIACLQLCPSFGTALTYEARDSLLASKMFIGITGATGTVFGIFGYVLYYWKFHKFPIKKLLYFMVIFTAVSNLFYLYIPNKWFLLIYPIIFGAFNGVAFLTLLSFFAGLVPSGFEGMVYPIITSISNLCGRGGSWIGGTIYDHWGYSTNVIISTLLTLLCLFFIPKLKIGEE